MKVAFVVSHFPILSETFILSQITSLIDQGHDVDIFAISPEQTAKHHPDIEKYQLLEKVYYLPLFPKKYYWRLLRVLQFLTKSVIQNPFLLIPILVELSSIFRFDVNRLLERCAYITIEPLRKKSYDVIHCHFAPNLIKGWVIKKINRGTPRLGVTFHGNDVNNHFWITKAIEYQPLLSDIDFYTANTNFTANKANKLGFPKEKISILPVGLNLDKYSLSNALLNKSEGEINILTVARLVEKKGIEYSIKAVIQLLKEYPNIIYKIVGDGELRENLEALVKQSNAENNIIFEGWKMEDEVRNLYNDSDIFVLSSVTAKNGDMEGQGLVLQEAQALGVPVVSTLHNGIPDGVKDGESGFLVPEKDAETLANKLRLLIEDAELRESMGKTGSKFVEENYNIDLLNQRLVDIYVGKT